MTWTRKPGIAEIEGLVKVHATMVSNNLLLKVKHLSAEGETVSIRYSDRYLGEIETMYDAVNSFLGWNAIYSPVDLGLMKVRFFVEIASLDVICRFLTACVRTERFCSGYFESKVSDGTLYRLICRLPSFSRCDSYGQG